MLKDLFMHMVTSKNNGRTLITLQCIVVHETIICLVIIFSMLNLKTVWVDNIDAAILAYLPKNEMVFNYPEISW